MLALFAACLNSCATAGRGDGSSYYYPSSNPGAVSKTSPVGQSIAAMAGSPGTPPRGGYAAGSGPTAMPGGNQFMYQQNVSGPFGSRSSSSVINSYGGVQSYQTIGNMPIYPGMAAPGGYYGNPRSFGRLPSQPVYVPGVGGAQSYYMNPSTGARVQGP